MDYLYWFLLCLAIFVPPLLGLLWLARQAWYRYSDAAARKRMAAMRPKPPETSRRP